jgi:phage-related protein
MANIIDITIRANDQTGAGVASASKSGNVLQGIFQGIGQKAAGMLAELPGKAIEFFSGAISAASDLGETVSKNQTIFGSASKGLLEWAENAPKALGMTRNAALEATGTLGNMFTQLGIGADKAAQLSEANVKLAADFASFHNADPTDVLEAMTAAYRGEYDAVQRFVPTLNAAAVEQEALTETHKKSKDALTDQDKALAVNTLMMKGAGAAAGDFSRTSDSAANRSRIAAASFEEIKVKIGNVLLPAWTMLLGFITGSFFPALEQLGSLIGSIVQPAFQMASDAVKLFIGAFTGEGADVSSLTGGWINTIIDLGAQARAVFDQLVAGWHAFTSAFSSGMTENEGSWHGFVNIMEMVGVKAHEVFEWIQTNVPPILDQLKSAFGSLVEKVTPLWEAMHMNQDILIALAAVIGGILLSVVWSLVGAVASLAVAVIAATWPFLAVVAAIALVVGALRYAYENWDWFRNGVDAVVQWLITTVPPIFEQVRAAIGVAFDWIVTVAVPFITQAFSSFMGFMTNTFFPAVQAVWNQVVAVHNWVVGVLTEIITRISNFIADNWNWISGLAAAIWNQITNTISTAWQVISNIVQLFLNIISGNWSGAWQNIQNIFGAVVGWLINSAQNLASMLGNAFMLIVSFAGNMLGGIANKLGELISWFTSLPGQILGAIGGLASEMFNAGARIIGGLIDGIKSKIGGAVDAVKGGLSQIRNLLPFSPAKEGPFSGRGYSLYSGQAIAESLAEGIRDRTRRVRAAAAGLVEAANGATRSAPSFPGSAMAMAAGAASAAAQVSQTHNWYVQGSIRADRDLIRLVRDEFSQLGLVPVTPR